MKIIILAAGKGTRLLPLTQNTPKPLLHLNGGKTLLETQIDNMIGSGVIDEVVLIIGYKAEQIEAKIKFYRNEKNIRIKTIYNPFYNVSNNLLSLWLAKHEMNEPFLITNGDNIFDSVVFREMATKTTEGIFLARTDIHKFNSDDMKVVEKANKVHRVSKLIKEEEATGESVGLVKVSGERFINTFKESLETLARNEEYNNGYWLEVFNLLADKAVSIEPFHLKRENWFEFDLHIDLETAQNILHQRMEKSI